MTRGKRTTKAIGGAAVIVAIAVAVLGIRWCYQHSRGIEIRVHNVDTRPLRSVEITVTGKSYSVGDLAPGARRSVWAKPASDSAVEISFTTSTGEVKHVSVPHSYIEPGNSGWMSVDLTAIEARNVEHHIGLY